MADSQDTTTGRSPAFQFYPKEFQSDCADGGFSLQEIGAYALLQCVIWNRGSVSADVAQLARVCGVPIAQMRRMWVTLRHFFVAHATEPDAITHPRLEKRLFEQAEFRRRQSDKGRASAAARLNRKATGPQPESNRGSAPVDSGLPPKLNSPISDLHLQTSVKKEHERASSGDPAMRAGDFIERYRSLHLRLRKGAHYIGKPTFDFQEALQLVAVYDDSRLDKLAYVWLNTDHDFAQNGTRTIAKFRSMCSWCEEQLIAWEGKHGPLEVAS